MRVISTSILMLVVSFGLLGQNDFDQRLLERYSEVQIIELQKSNPQILNYWVFFADHSYQIFEISSEKQNIQLEEIDLDLENFNVLAYDFSEYRKSGAYLRISGTNQMIKFLSYDELIPLYNSHLKQN